MTSGTCRLASDGAPLRSHLDHRKRTFDAEDQFRPAEAIDVERGAARRQNLDEPDPLRLELSSYRDRCGREPVVRKLGRAFQPDRAIPMSLFKIANRSNLDTDQSRSGNRLLQKICC
jgi:hypothetical protein